MRARTPVGPSLFDEGPTQVEAPPSAPKGSLGPPPGPVGDGALYRMTAEERAAAGVPLPDRSRWALPGRGEVEVRGSSPLMVWFVTPGAPPLTQATLYRTEFLRKARRLRW